MDPLEDHRYENTYDKLLFETEEDERVIVASPELHGRPVENAIMVWRWIKKVNERHYMCDKNFGVSCPIMGVVTKYPKYAEEVLGGIK
jgi:hypothetical protein